MTEGRALASSASDEYQVLVTDSWKSAGDEPLGSKKKEWIDEGSPPASRRWLFKQPQTPLTGDDWAERIVAAIADELGIPHAQAELATRNGEKGIVSLDLTDYRRRGELLHGNDLLLIRDRSYPRNEHRTAGAKYSLDAVLAVVEQAWIDRPPMDPLAGVETALDVFIGYLLLDALVANQDRHHENWGVLVRLNLEQEEVHAELAPSFDHASSLARSITDDERRGRLVTRDSAYSVEAFCSRARSLFAAPGVDRLTTIEAAKLAGARSPSAYAVWLEKLHALDEDALERCVARVPASRMTTPAREFSTAMLKFNRRRLLEAERA